MIFSAVSGLKISFIFSGRWYSIIFLSFLMRLIHSWTELSLPSAFFFPRHQKTFHKTFCCEWTYLGVPVCWSGFQYSISQSLTFVTKLAVNTYQLFLKGGEVHQQLYGPIQCPEGVPYSSHNHPLIFWTFLSILIKTLKVALNWNN